MWPVMDTGFNLRRFTTRDDQSKFVFLFCHLDNTGSPQSFFCFVIMKVQLFYSQSTAVKLSIKTGAIVYFPTLQLSMYLFVYFFFGMEELQLFWRFMAQYHCIFTRAELHTHERARASIKKN